MESKMTTQTEPKESTTYGTMLTQLEQLVSKVSSGQQDLDDMVQTVSEGFELAAKIRKRLEETKKEVDDLREKYL